MLLSGCGSVERDRVEWTVMGTVAALQTRGRHLEHDTASQKTLAAVMGATRDVEALLNAHDPHSRLSRLAGMTEDEVLLRCDEGCVSSGLRTRPCYEAAFRLAEASGGAFNPRWRGDGTLDLGAIAKGFAADLASDASRECRVDALIDLGGSLKVLRASSGPWRAGVKDPVSKGVAAVVDLGEGEALATSATYYRGSHIFDGRTGRPVANGVASVTVLCRSAMWADGLSTALFVLGPDDGRRFVSERLPAVSGGIRVAVLWILDDGRQVRLDPDGRFMRSGMAPGGG